MSAASKSTYRRLRHEAEQSAPSKALAADFFARRTRHLWAGDGWRAHPLFDHGPHGAFADVACSYAGWRRKPLSSLPLSAQRSFAQRQDELDDELREVVASLSRPLLPPRRTPEQIERIVDAVMRGY